MTQTRTAGIRRPNNTNIDSLLEGYTPQAPETVRRLEVTEGDHRYKTLLAKLEAYLEKPHSNKEFRNRVSSITEVLTPDEINDFLQRTVQFEQKANYRDRTSEFISKLIQNSYNRGHNNFTLNLENLPGMDFIGDHLEGTEERMLLISIKGKTGDYCGNNAKYTVFRMQDTGDWCGNHAKHSRFIIRKTGKNTGSFSEGLEFRTSDPETLQKLLAEVLWPMRVIYTNQDGNAMKKDYDY